jgi:alpha-galactosidase/6-phospho-beta-glucosidase family protein
MPELRHHLLAGATAGQPRAERIAQETGYLLCPGDDHTKDFLPPAGEASLTAAWHGTPEERQNQLEQLRGIADGRLPWDALLHHPAWERPLDFIAALSYDRPAFFHALNLINRGQIPQLPTGVFVETPCAVSSGGLSPQTVSLPKAVRPYCEQAARVTDTIVRAARERSRARLYEAVELDPTILDKRAGRQAIDACLNAHADLLPAYTD